MEVSMTIVGDEHGYNQPLHVDVLQEMTRIDYSTINKSNLPPTISRPLHVRLASFVSLYAVVSTFPRILICL